MPSTSRKVVVRCDICGDEMHHQVNGAACFPCQNFIPADLFYRYAEHVTLNNDFAACDECGEHQETGFINDEGVCMDCEEVQSGN